MESGKTVLIIDDEPLVLESIATFLELGGFDVLAVRDGKVGVEMAAKQQPDVIISNFSMPHIDGLGVFERVRQDPKTADIPFIFFSAHGTTSVREQCLKMGADAFLDKGLEPDELLDTLKRLIKSREPN